MRNLFYWILKVTRAVLKLLDSRLNKWIDLLMHLKVFIERTEFVLDRLYVIRSRFRFLLLAFSIMFLGLLWLFVWLL